MAHFFVPASIALSLVYRKGKFIHGMYYKNELLE
jgi:hypothetical protein